MRTRTLGRTGIEVSELALGGLFLSTEAGAFERARDAVLRAVALGVNYVDTAPAYGDSEEVVGRILADVAAPVILSTKLGGRPKPFNARDRDGLRRSVDESLRLLHRDVLDIVFIHEADRPEQYDWWSDPDRYGGPVMDLLNELRAAGVVRYIGIGGTTAYEMANLIRSGSFDIVLTAFNYSLLWREAEREIFPAAVERGMGVVVGSPLQQGALAQRYDDEVRSARWLSPPRRAQFQALYELVDQTGLSLPELALRFVLSNSAISCVLMGARSADEVERNVQAWEHGSLPRPLLDRLDEIAAMVPFRPFDEPAFMPFRRAYAGPGPMR